MLECDGGDDKDDCSLSLACCDDSLRSHKSGPTFGFFWFHIGANLLHKNVKNICTFSVVGPLYCSSSCLKL